MSQSKESQRANEYTDPLGFDQSPLEVDPPSKQEKELNHEVTIYDLEGMNFSPTKLTLVFIICFMLNMGNNIDHGAIPIIVPELKKDVSQGGGGMSTDQIGFLGSLVFLGVLFGSWVGTKILGKFKYYKLIFFSVFTNGLGLLLFASTKNYYIMCASRLLSGCN